MTTYRAWLEAGAGETIIHADSIEEALAEAREWAADGSYDQPGHVTLHLTQLGPDGDGIPGMLRMERVQVG